MESMKLMIKQLMNEIIYLNKNKGDRKKTFKPFIRKRNNTDTPPQIPPTSRINLHDYDMNNFCRIDHANHSDKTCLEFINSFSVMLFPPDPPKKDEEEDDNDDNEEGEEEEAKGEHPSNLNLIWDDI